MHGTRRPTTQELDLTRALLPALPGAALATAQVATHGTFHDVVLVPGHAVVRIARRTEDAAALPRRVELLRRLAGANLPFAVPRPLSPVVPYREIGPFADLAAVALSWVPGAPSRPQDGGPRLVGELLRAVGGVDLAAVGDVLDVPHAFLGRERWAEVLTSEVVPLLDPPWRAEAARRVESALVLPDVPATLVHGDLAGSNIHVENGRVVGVIDWDLAQAFDPAVDAACLGWFGWETLAAAVPPETMRRARVWFGTFGLEQVGVALRRRADDAELATQLARAQDWLARTTALVDS
ncbi:aminoglycoside phosphotransferase [Beutenbergia cavernae DSM 12333]|uniref:Aminoglycoside phosphotransferase n=1 Tax=Beutenbergia cavernae (strain ATCC BAA-8 / DSM 12333 / CCUG 43141 / JCM 11478 / NBRC 16432 / NCIMB 13614 / HKI 0122) TaxID=471853 RepID=C5C1M0_BEUC1|nr:phosphotransferase [Beutenbergia cavernae]ACQ79488.1 aminoglycoside phosphotransferase [Beutenbergia cavernae DSM 12333]